MAHRPKTQILGPRRRRAEAIPRENGTDQGYFREAAYSEDTQSRALERVRFEPGRLGMQLEMNSGQVTKVDADGQAERKGVLAGWIVKAVNGNPFSEHLLLVTTSDGHPYDLTFEKVRVKTLSAKQFLETLRFEPGWLGIEVDMGSGQLIKVHADSQAGRQGVDVTWFLKLINGQPFSEALLRSTISSGFPYELSFRKPQSKHPLKYQTMSLERVRLEPGRLGIELEMSSGKVSKVDADSQAGKKGVEVHWSLKLIDGIPFTEDLLRATASSGLPYELAFQKPLSKGIKKQNERLMFEPGRLGMEVDTSSGQVSKVYTDGQAGSKGVDVSWCLKLIDGNPFTEDLLRHKAGAGFPYELTFERPGLSQEVSDVVPSLASKRKNKKCRQRDLALIEAAKDGDSSRIINIFDLGGDIDRTDRDGIPQICYAVLHGHLSVVRTLCGLAADLNNTDRSGRTALLHAVDRERTDIVNSLCQAEADVNRADGDGWTPLHLAVKNVDVDTVFTLCAHSVNKEPVDSLNGFTPLLLAVLAGNSEISSILCQEGADLDNPGGLAMPPLCFAASSGSFDVISVLCEFSASIEKGTSNGRTPLAVAAHCGHEDVVDFLCAKQADPNAMDQYGWTPVFQATGAGLPSVVYILCQNGGDANVIDKYGRSALGLAASHGDVEIVQILCEFGAQVDRFGERCAPLYEASYAGHLDVVRTLIAYHADAGSQSGLKAQVVASQRGHQSVARYLAREDR